MFCAYIALGKDIFWVGNSFVLFTILYLNPRIVPDSVYRCLHNKYLLKGSSTTQSAYLLHSFYFTSFLNFILSVLFFILRFLFMNIYVRSVFLQVICLSVYLSVQQIYTEYLLYAKHPSKDTNKGENQGPCLHVTFMYVVG